MSPEEDEVSLVVEGCGLSSLELRDGGEQRVKHAANQMSQSRGKVVQDQFGLVSRRAAVALAVSTRLTIAPTSISLDRTMLDSLK